MSLTRVFLPPLLIVALTAASVAVWGTGSVDAQSAEITLLHAIPGVEAEVWVAGELLVGGFELGDREDLSGSAGETLVDFEVRDAASGAVLIAVDGGSVLLPSTRAWTIVAHRDLAGLPTLSVFVNDDSVVAEGQGRLTVRNLTDTDGLGVAVDGQTFADQLLVLTQASEAIAQGIYAVSVSDGADVVIVDPFDVTLSGGESVILYVVGSDAGPLVIEQRRVIPTAREFCDGRAVTVSIALGETPTPGDDVILGTAGNDVIAAGAGNDLVCGGGGDDSIWGQDGDDVIWGDAGDDRLRGGAGADRVYGGEGADSLGGGPGDDVVDGEGGNDIAVRGNTGNDVVRGGAGDDLLVAGNGGRDQVFGGDGDDVKVTGGPRPDLVDGGDGDDQVKGNKGADTLYGGAGNDAIFGGPQADTIDGGEGADTCNGGTTGGEPPPAESDVAVSCEGVLTAIP